MNYGDLREHPEAACFMICSPPDEPKRKFKEGDNVIFHIKSVNLDVEGVFERYIDNNAKISSISTPVDVDCLTLKRKFNVGDRVRINDPRGGHEYRYGLISGYEDDNIEVIVNFEEKDLEFFEKV